MTIFRIIAYLALAGLVAVIASDSRRRMRSWRGAGASLVSGFRSVLRRKGAAQLGSLGRIRSGTGVVTAVLALLLAATGFLPALLYGSHPSGILLVIHVTLAPLFAVSLTALALLWAHRLRFEAADRHIVERTSGGEVRSLEALVRFSMKIGFWTLLGLSLPLMLTIILSLFPLYGTEGETLLIRLHAYSALLFMLTALGEIYILIAYIDLIAGHILKEPKP
jgi:hypothetical protein